ncbi:MAG TPA: subclass B3 metallo-beta-lactamase [Cytophagales bacterium]|nr:subclass B3 metallo-beta-lactamase [Cytophagales bacterium]
MKKLYVAIALLFLLNISSPAQQVKEPKAFSEEWSKPYPPFRIVGNLYYVGTYDLACYLITTQQGHILINTGLANSESQIESNVKKLGFRFSDIKILLTTQAHFDHVGAMASIKKKTQAKMMVDEKDASTLKDGGRSDYFFGGDASAFEPIEPDRLLKDREIISLGDMQLTLLHHPGHTKGSCSFLFIVKDDQKSYQVLIVNMPSIIVDGKLSEVTKYPEMSSDYAYTLKAMKGISFDVWLASHTSQFNMHLKHKSGDGYNPKVFIDRKGYDQALAELQKDYHSKK